MLNRPNTSVTLYDMSALLRSPLEKCEVVPMTAPAAAAALPLSAAGAVQEYNTYNRTPEAAVCSGTIVVTNDTVGVLYQDALVSTSATYVTKAPMILFQIVAADVAGIVSGVDMYLVSASKRVTMTAAGNIYIGKCIGACETNPLGLPAGIYAPINFNQEQI